MLTSSSNRQNDHQFNPCSGQAPNEAKYQATGRQHIVQGFCEIAVSGNIKTG
jgi:hypothetical protein